MFVEVEAALQHDVDHFRSAELAPVHLDAALFPGVHDLVLAEPLAIEHHTVVRHLVQIEDVLQTELHLLMLAAQRRVVVVVRFGEVRD